MTLSSRDIAGYMLTLLVTLTTLTVRSRAANIYLTDPLPEKIVQFHNRFRTDIKAKKMLQLRWDKTLADEALEWVEKCDFRHKENNTRGQNIYRSELNDGVAKITVRGVKSWSVEISYMMVAEKTGDPCCDAGENTTLCCNYQQVVWSDTRKVGCGLTRCAYLTGPDKDYPNAWFLACFYDPPGNYAGVRPFVRAGTGEVCSDCPYIFNQCQNSLCAPSTFCRGNP